jgi:phosphatidylcholine synthase
LATPTRARALAWGVHLYTGLGAPIALAGLWSTVRGDARGAFLWMALALFIDATDGTLARAARVKEVVPEFDGARLDDIVDYLNYTIVPLFFAVYTGMFSEAVALPVAGFAALASVYGFCQLAAKTDDFFFTGFPSYWNIAVFYMFAARLPPAVNAAVIALLAVLVFVPIGYLYPSRNPTLRPLTLALAALWSVASLVVLAQLPEPSQLLVWASFAFPIYYFALSLWLDFRRRRRN